MDPGKAADRIRQIISSFDPRFTELDMEALREAKEMELCEKLATALEPLLLRQKIPFDFVHSETGEIILPANRLITKGFLRKIARMHQYFEMEPSGIRNKIREIIRGHSQESFDGRLLSMQASKEALIHAIHFQTRVQSFWRNQRKSNLLGTVFRDQ